MKIAVRSGDVQLRSVQVRGHSRGVYTIELKTPFDWPIGVIFSEEADKSTGICTTVDIYAPLQDQATRVILFPEIERERLALTGWLSYEAKDRGLTEILAMPDCLVDRRGGLVASWELPSARVDYLEGEY